MRSLQRKLMLFSFFDSLMFIYPLYAIFFAQNGLSVQQISLLLVVWAIVSGLLQLPAGVLADHYSRKLILIIGQVAQVMAFTVWVLVPSFEGFLIGFLLWSVKTAFVNGTFEALMYDEIAELGHSEMYAKMSGRTNGIGLLALVIAGLGAAALVHVGFGAVVIASNVALVASIIITLTLPNTRPRKDVVDHDLFAHLQSGYRSAVRSPYIFRLLLLQLVVLMAWGISDEYWTLFYKELGLNKQMISVAYAASCLLAAVGMLAAPRFLRLKLYQVTLVTACAAAVLLVSATLANFDQSVIISIATFFIFDLVVASVVIIIESKLQHAAHSSVRATILSLGKFSSQITVVLGYAFFAAFSGAHRVSGGYQAVAILTIVTCALVGYMTWHVRHKPIPQPSVH